ncbi:glycosyltransferase family 4 protein [Polynucleobacter sp. JS-JIR-II-b4]|uniref:glycosyltransferase family 4 protein n=1 Tax=Polynucleobacter sp. JS-JIR-II-b4 TaxID=1758390 RepID=UPI001BFEE4DB|nr:glycosyltransferase family 4 protein [Polynucleobacter sp. JS-JIR-II-b4]QWE02854.1 glycosyltransferase family 4 protein [Polynucleobacter sp. JS-JIR-II-b4]
MKIAFLTLEDPKNILAWSGIPFFLSQALIRRGHDLIFLGPLQKKYNLFTGLKSVIYKYLLGKKYLRDRDVLQINSYSQQIRKKLKDIDCDLILSTSTLPVSNLNALDQPIVTWCDATFYGVQQYYPEFTNLCSETRNSGNKLESSALENVSLAIFSSAWAAQSALDGYGTQSNKVKVIQFGANINQNRDIELIKDNIFNKRKGVCKLLFIGVDWIRKGGDLALKIADNLNRMGLVTELHIVGCTPLIDHNPSFLIKHGFLNKNIQQDNQILDELFLCSHFLLVPSMAECYGLVFAEASSWGLPSITRLSGGIASVVKSGVNGYAFDPSASIDDYCQYIFDKFSNSPEYEALSLSTLNHYEDVLNWDVAIKKFEYLTNEILKK